MSKDHWDAILASAPLNATAGKVTGKGYAYEPSKKVVEHLWDTAPTVRKHIVNPQAPDLVGVKFGRLTVIGLWDEPDRPADVKAKWICRCSCGKFVARSSKAIRNPANGQDRCPLCRHVEFLARSASGDEARRRAESEKARKWTAA